MALLFIYFLFVFSLIWIYGGYPLFIIILSKIFEKKYIIDESYAPNVTLIVPTHNEETVISKKIENILNLNYAKEKLQIIGVDSASTDKTRELVKKYSGDGVELVEESERKGKGAAIMHALDFAKSDIALITDANSYFESDALKYLLRHFSDPLVGGVTGRYLGKATNNNAESSGTVTFRDYENNLLKYESKIDSVVCLWGEIFAIRKNLFSLDKENLSEDFYASLYIRKKGYRLVYEPKAQVYEYAPSNLQDLIIQKKRTITGTIQCLFKYKQLLFNPRYGFFGTVILPSHKLLPVFSPMFLTGFLIFSVIFWKTVSPYVLFAVLLMIIIAGLLAGNFFNFINLLKYVIELNIACVLAWKDYVTGDYSVRWEKMKSSRIIPS